MPEPFRASAVDAAKLAWGVLMGGYGSGRQGGGPTVESGLALDINRLLRQRNILPGKHVSGSLSWSYVHSGEKTASIGYEASLVNPETARARLHYTANGAPATMAASGGVPSPAGVVGRATHPTGWRREHSRRCKHEPRET